MGMKKPCQPIRVLLVDNNPTLLWGLSKLIKGEWPRMALAGAACSRAEALSRAVTRPGVILMDLELDGRSAMDILPELLRHSGGRVLFFNDLEGNLIHLIERPAGSIFRHQGFC